MDGCHFLHPTSQAKRTKMLDIHSKNPPMYFCEDFAQLSKYLLSIRKVERGYPGEDKGSVKYRKQFWVA